MTPQTEQPQATATDPFERLPAIRLRSIRNRPFPVIDDLELGLIIASKFLERCSAVKTERGCIEWKGDISDKSYGRFLLAGRVYLAHRTSYWLFMGEDPSDYDVLHECDNPPCVNWEHLHLGTFHQNIREAVLRGRFASGARHGTKTHPESYRGLNAKLTKASVQEIRRLWKTGDWSQRELGLKFGVATPTAQAVIERRSWAYVQDQPVEEFSL